MAQRSCLVILKYNKHKVPTFAYCSVCHYKFFTAFSLLRDRPKAERYLLNKFERHQCSSDVSSTATQNLDQYLKNVRICQPISHLTNASVDDTEFRHFTAEQAGLGYQRDSALLTLSNSAPPSFAMLGTSCKIPTV